MSFAELLAAKKAQHNAEEKVKQCQQPDTKSNNSPKFNARGHLTQILQHMGISPSHNVTYDCHSVHPNPVANKKKPEVIRGPFKCTVKIRLPGDEEKSYTTEPFQTIKAAEHQANLLALTYLYVHPQYLQHQCKNYCMKEDCLLDFLETKFGLSVESAKESVSFEIYHEHPDEESTINIGKLIVSLPFDDGPPKVYTQRQHVSLNNFSSVGDMRKRLYSRALSDMRKSYMTDMENDVVKCRKNGHVLGKMKDFVFFTYPSFLMEDVASTLSSGGGSVGSDGVCIRFCVNSVGSEHVFDRLKINVLEENESKTRAAYCVDCILQSSAQFNALIDDAAFNDVCKEYDRIGTQFPRKGSHGSLLCLQQKSVTIGGEKDYKDPMHCESWLGYVQLHGLVAQVDPNIDTISPEEVERVITKEQEGALSPDIVKKRVRYPNLVDNDVDVDVNKPSKKAKKKIKKRIRELKSSLSQLLEARVTGNVNDNVNCGGSNHDGGWRS